MRKGAIRGRGLIVGIWESIGKSNEWYTPKYVFDALGCEFDLDVASHIGPTHVPANEFICENSLQRPWRGFIWMNPPFGGRNGIIPWLDKFFEHGNGIALTPDRTSAPWWAVAAKKADAILFVTGKIQFERADGTKGKQPGNGTTLFACGQRAVAALERAQHLGVVLK